ncbi:baseplate J/gp47 family protein [Microvirga zambiensis]|uniref:baseplate J/gp47 family protein n=1 Tax=Microvirga zambiensis TaxID=1402137 RepID=UPI00191D416C|nr:baseplate J/gp47 family protein [Microvirga zambiensis]
MTFVVPKLSDLSQRARLIISEATEGATIDLWPNLFPILAKILALLGKEWHLRLKFLYRQLFASTADEVWLVRHGFELGITRIPAKVATGYVTVDVPVSTVVPYGITFRRADGALFRTRTSAIGAGAGTSLEFEAIDAGTLGNTDAAQTLTLVDTGVVTGLGDTATVSAGGLGGGADVEPIETLRQRILDRKRNPPQGGSATDWIRWTKESSGAITRVFVDSFINDSREVWISFLRSDRTNGIPTPSDVAAVQAYVEDPIRRPVTARVSVVAPDPQPVDITITGLSPDTPAIRAAVEAELDAMFADKVAPATPSTNFILWRAWISEAISRATGENKHTLTVPASDLTYSTAGQMPVRGVVTYPS